MRLLYVRRGKDSVQHYVDAPLKTFSPGAGKQHAADASNLRECGCIYRVDRIDKDRILIGSLR
jgi:hypothetical protein